MFIALFPSGLRRSRLAPRIAQGDGMSERPEDFEEMPGTGGNAPEFTVSELSGAIRRVVEGEFGHVRVRGEIGRVSRPRSGHVYLDLKDDRNVLSGVIWKGTAMRMRTKPEEGLEVIVTGRITTFGGQSKYQIVIDDVRPAGVGALMAMLERRRKELEAEGLFEEERKKPLPFLPEVIGVITSPSGAVIRDILHRLRDRFPRKVLIWPVAVQGERCSSEVARAIQGFNGLPPNGEIARPDLLIVARGGGSIEDLWGFNEESVVRAVAASDIPLISAVGHETDTTLIDFAADRRAPTPTAAAELAVPVRLELVARLEAVDARQTRAIAQAVNVRSQRLLDIGRALPRAEALMSAASQRLDLWCGRLPQALATAARERRIRLAEATSLLHPATLARSIADRRRLMEQVGSRLAPGSRRSLRDLQRVLDQRSEFLRMFRPRSDIERRRGSLDQFSARLETAVSLRIDGWSGRLDALERLRQTLGYAATLRRGYAVVRGNGVVVTTKAEAMASAGLEIEFSDGKLRLGDRRGRGKKPPSGEQPRLL